MRSLSLFAAAALAVLAAGKPLQRGNVVVHKRVNFENEKVPVLALGKSFTVTYGVYNVGLSPAYDIKVHDLWPESSFELLEGKPEASYKTLAACVPTRRRREATASQPAHARRRAAMLSWRAPSREACVWRPRAGRWRVPTSHAPPHPTRAVQRRERDVCCGPAPARDGDDAVCSCNRRLQVQVRADTRVWWMTGAVSLCPHDARAAAACVYAWPS